jgi:hypothetical protein
MTIEPKWCPCKTLQSDARGRVAVTIQIELKPEIEAEMKARALRTGLPLNQYLQHLLEQQVPGQPAESVMTPEERATSFQNWAVNFPSNRTAPLSDDAISREAFYRPDYE